MLRESCRPLEAGLEPSGEEDGQFSPSFDWPPSPVYWTMDSAWIMSLKHTLTASLAVLSDPILQSPLRTVNSLHRRRVTQEQARTTTLLQHPDSDLWHLWLSPSRGRNTPEGGPTHRLANSKRRPSVQWRANISLTTFPALFLRPSYDPPVIYSTNCIVVAHGARSCLRLLPSLFMSPRVRPHLIDRLSTSIHLARLPHT